MRGISLQQGMCLYKELRYNQNFTKQYACFINFIYSNGHLKLVIMTLIAVFRK